MSGGVVGSRRAQVGGSFARTGVPLPVSTTAYNAANELTQWGTANLFYDANGNPGTGVPGPTGVQKTDMTTSDAPYASRMSLRDGTNSFVWNARNHLASINAGLDTFQYDLFGRRTAKTTSGAKRYEE